MASQNAHVRKGNNYIEQRRYRAATKFIIIDGSNVAYGNGNGDPYAKNIKLVVDALRTKGFNRILIITDASLAHVIQDRDILEDLKNEEILKESPAKIEADYFIIEYAKEKDALIISNDTFRDWMMKDQWVAENISGHRVPFMIDEGIVKLGDLLKDNDHELSGLLQEIWAIVGQEGGLKSVVKKQLILRKYDNLGVERAINSMINRGLLCESKDGFLERCEVH